MELLLIFTIIFVVTTSIFFFLSYRKYKYNIDHPQLPPCLKANNKHKNNNINEPLCKNLYVRKQDKDVYIIVPILIGLVAASAFCLIYVLI